jgi:hypothetical protein
VAGGPLKKAKEVMEILEAYVNRPEFGGVVV